MACSVKALVRAARLVAAAGAVIALGAAIEADGAGRRWGKPLWGQWAKPHDDLGKSDLEAIGAIALMLPANHRV
jgi:hypothetical protein